MPRASRHNGGTGSHGTYNPKHNDREFDFENAEDIKDEFTASNIYWNCIDRQLVRHGELNESSSSFTEVEKLLCQRLCGAFCNRNRCPCR